MVTYGPYWSGSGCWWAWGSGRSPGTRDSVTAVSLWRIAHIMFTHILYKHTLIHVSSQYPVLKSLREDLQATYLCATSNWILSLYICSRLLIPFCSLARFTSFSSPIVVLYARTSQTVLNSGGGRFGPSSGHIYMSAPLTINYTTLQYIFL